MNILVIGAHPDDYELGMAGTIKKYASEGHQIISIIMSDGEAIGNTNKRKKEAQTAATFLGIKKTYFFHFKDRQIPSGKTAIQKIEKIIQTHNIDRIYTHSLRDTHQDHRNTCAAVLSAGRKTGQILFFESPSSVVEFRPTLFVNIAEQLSAKLTALQLYRSLQRFKKRYLEIKAIQSCAAFRGYQSNLPAAESFEVFRFVEP
jgi:LmbE family N-acetylglucosaminyl deacetylase